ncbi:MgtC/SapB family protein [Chitinophaga caseinilytica]|uniref:MgtC/SapB family protein n=1 Tax=Chitinophaga caseinilytica TaxID=2267521 RepID=A0ABZ2YYC0_9BACT
MTAFHIEYAMIIKLAVAMLAGFLLGLEREVKRKAAGVRTITLICMSSALFSILSIHFGGLQSGDRIASNILTGVGFIGAGVIFRGGFTIDGITTAAVIWISAAIGMAIGVGKYDLAAFAVFFTLFTLWVFSIFERIIQQRHDRKYYAIQYAESSLSPETLENIFRAHHLKAQSISTTKSIEQGSGRIIYEGKYELRGSSARLKAVNDALLANMEVIRFEVELAK